MTKVKQYRILVARKTSAEVDKETGVYKQLLNTIETNGITSTAYEVAKKLADCYGVKSVYELAGENEPIFKFGIHSEEDKRILKEIIDGYKL